MADRRALGLWLRIVAGVTMLAILLTRIDLDGVVPEWDAATGAWLVAALLATAGGVVAAACRWEAVLAGLDRPAPLRRLLGHQLVGQFVGNFLPSTIGGDVLRARRLTVETGDGATAFASIVLDRLTGMLVLPALTLSAFAVNRGLLRVGGASWAAVLLSVVVLVLLAAILWLVGHPRIGGRVTGSGRWRRFAGAVHLGTDRFRRHPRAIVGVVVAAFAFQLLMVVAAFCAARALDIDHVGITAVLAFVPAVAMAQVVPVTFGGLGVREGALALFLAQLDVPTGRAVALGLVIYALQLIVSLAGAPAFVVGNRRTADEVAA